MWSLANVTDAKRPRVEVDVTWVVKVVLALEGLRLLLRSQDFVEAVLAHDGHLPLAVVHLILPQQLHDLGTNRGLWQSVVG